MVRHHQPRKGSVAFSPRKRVAKEESKLGQVMKNQNF